MPKGVYPYEWMTDEEKLYTTLPSKECFHSELYNEDIAIEEYKHAREVWELLSAEHLKIITLYI